MRTTTLYFKEGSSDKVYQATIEPKGTGFLVNFAFGRRGSTLNTGTKTQEPVDLASAEKLFEKLVREKKAKGYTGRRELNSILDRGKQRIYWHPGSAPEPNRRRSNREIPNQHRLGHAGEVRWQLKFKPSSEATDE